MIEKGAKWWNDGQVNKRSVECPGAGFILGRISYTRKPLSEKTKQKIKQSNKGKIPWNKGKNNIYSAETLEKMKKAKHHVWRMHSLTASQLAWGNEVAVSVMATGSSNFFTMVYRSLLILSLISASPMNTHLLLPYDFSPSCF